MNKFITIYGISILEGKLLGFKKLFQQILGFDNNRIKWVHDDILNVSLNDIDFIYLYRPSKPVYDGHHLYEVISQKLANREKQVTIFSIADCLKEFLDSKYSMFYSDGHLTCFENSND